MESSGPGYRTETYVYGGGLSDAPTDGGDGGCKGVGGGSGEVQVFGLENYSNIRKFKYEGTIDI